MNDIQRIAGSARGRSSGAVFGGFGWAVATSDDPVDDLYRQTKHALAKIDGILAKMGTDRSRILSATVYITDMAHKADMDRAWCEWIGDDPQGWPQRACVEAGLHGTDLVEVVLLVAV